MAVMPTCECKNTCRTHRENPCGTPAKLMGWPSESARREEEPHSKLCVACAGELVTKGWALRADPLLRLRG